MSQPKSIPAAASATLENDWSSISAPDEKRRVQNRNTQRKYPDSCSIEKVRLQKEHSKRDIENMIRASGAYVAPEAKDFDTGEETGLPWGSISMRHIVAFGKAKEQSLREASLYTAASRAGRSSRVGLHLLDKYARGSPVWATWRKRLSAHTAGSNVATMAMCTDHGES
ncbi:hypothetical protein Tdes44962_MAKER05316 [Teratosphaeria destructans]|uniref:Uncharacterized protein n=1 Tax=Teratosphaeria destructans TaxID=418781 RepID=A0A9W7VYR5_9PEZI|nr:hypothetical protein Tdes44962_MAKER05316 [Teratosphaeria destructans]